MRALFLVLMLAGCSVTDVAIDRINDEVVMRYCENVSPDIRAASRQALAQECDDCGIVVRCPGETWDSVMQPLGYSASPLP